MSGCADRTWLMTSAIGETFPPQPGNMCYANQDLIAVSPAGGR